MRLRAARKKLEKLDRRAKQFERAVIHEIKVENRGNAQILKDALEKVDRERVYLEDEIDTLEQKERFKSART